MDGGSSSNILDARLLPKVDLPTAPRASRGSIVDDSKIPTTGPFQAYLSNIPYDLIEDDLVNFFQDLRVISVRLPKEEKSSKAKGFGYIEFEDRASLSSALNLADTTIKGRAMKIELPNGDMGGKGGNRRNNRDGGRDQTSSDRTTGNWRAGPRQDDVDDRYDRGGGGSGYGGRRDFGGGSSSSSGGFNRGGYDDRSYHREERFDRGREDRGGGGGGRDERGGSFRDRYDRGDRGGFGGRGDRGGDREGFSYNDRGFRDRGTRDDDRFSRNDDRGSSGGASGSGHWRDDQQRGGDNRGFSSGGGGRFDDRRDRRGDDRDRDGGGKFGPPRRDEGPPIDRGNESRNRPKLQLQPRTKPKENAPEAPSTAASIFGGAKPVDTAAREREIEERLMRSEDFNDSKSKTNSSSAGSTRGEGVSSSRGEGGSASRGDNKQWETTEKKVEPAPPPKENAWSRKAAQTVNNGRSSPDDEVCRSNLDSDEIDQDDSRSRRSGGDDRCHVNSRGPVTTTSDKPRGKEMERNISNKHRERKESIDDISKMPKVPETKAPNFAVSNKYSSLVDSDEAPDE